MCTRLASTLALALLTPLAGCDETLINVSTDGQIQVAVNTSGLDTDTDGFSVSLDGGTAQFVDAGGTVHAFTPSVGAAWRARREIASIDRAAKAAIFRVGFKVI